LGWGVTDVCEECGQDGCGGAGEGHWVGRRGEAGHARKSFLDSQIRGLNPASEEIGLHVVFPGKQLPR